MKLNTVITNFNNKPISTAKLAVLLGCIFLTACGSEEKKEHLVFTQLNELVPASYVCKDALLKVGSELILQKNHYLNLQQADDRQLNITGVLEYNDRPAHVSFSAYKNQGGQCVVGYELSYQLDTPCMAVREEAFKKYNQIGTLGDKTRYFEYKRNPDKKVFLTNINQDLQCLVGVNLTETVVPAP